MTLEELRQQMSAAVRHHEAGRYADAETAYRQILAQSPNQPDALHLLGALAGQTGRLAEAIDLMSKAVAVNPTQPVYHCNLSEIYRRAGKPEEAISSARQAIRLNPKLARGYCVMGSALTHVRRFDDAVAAFRRAIELQPDYIEAMNHLGNTLHSLGQFDDAIGVFTRVCRLRPDSVDGLCGLGTALREAGRPQEAIPILRQALGIQPELSSAHNNLGIALSQTDQLDDAIAEFRRAIQFNPGDAIAIKNLGVALAEQGRFDESLAALDEAIRLKPDMSEAHGNRALVLLLKGDFERGWAEYEWRWRARLTTLSVPRDFTEPRWHGEPLDGKTILLHAEQGFGDTIQFVRYLPMVARRGGRIILECPIELLRLLRNAPGVEKIVTIGESLPRFDCHCPLLGLPLAFETRLESIPADIPYISPDPESVTRWKARLEPSSELRVGLAWAGNPKNQLDRKRSIAIEKLSRLAAVSGVRFFSLQKGGKEPIAAPPGMALTDWTSELLNFADTGALIANLDLVLTVDTAVAHLAGAMGKPVWVMLPFMPDWRWLLNRTDSPWYPSMRLFRQKSLGDWAGVIENVAESLTKMRDTHRME